MRNRFLLLALLGLTTLAVSQASLDKLKPLKKLKLPELPIFCEEPVDPCSECTCTTGELPVTGEFDTICECDVDAEGQPIDGQCIAVVEDTCPCNPEALNWLEYAQCLIDAALISIQDWPTCAGLLGDELEECETTCEGDEELSPEAYVECIKEFIEGLEDLSILDKKKEVIKGATSKLTGAKDKLTGAASLLQRFEIPPLPKCDLELIEDQEEFSLCSSTCDIAGPIAVFYGCVGGFNVDAPYVIPPCPEILGEFSEEALELCEDICEGNTATLSTEEYFDCIKEIFDEISVRDIFG